jgi:hypothetical protein
MVIFKHIDRCGRKLARTNLLLEEEIEFGEAAALGLGKAEVCVYDTEKAAAGPEEASVVAPSSTCVSTENIEEEKGMGDENLPIPCARVEHVRC